MTALTITQASLALGVAQDTVRKKVRSGEISATKERCAGGFRWMVEIDRNGHHHDTPPAPPEATTGDSSAKELVEFLKSQIQDLRDQIADRTREISELHQLLGARSLAPGVDRPWWQIWKR